MSKQGIRMIFAFPGIKILLLQLDTALFSVTPRVKYIHITIFICGKTHFEHCHNLIDIYVTKAFFFITMRCYKAMLPRLKNFIIFNTDEETDFERLRERNFWISVEGTFES
jgi:galactose-1-phosphate uridylyltransferase